MMDISALKAQIKTNTLNPYYIFTGTDVGVMDIYLEQMSKASGHNIKKVSCITEITQKLTKSAFIKNAEICVFRDCRELYTDAKVNALILSKNEHIDDIFVFIYTALDKRTKFYKQVAENVVEFNALPTDILIKYVAKLVTLPEKLSRKFIEVCENDYSRILLECDKIKRYADAKEITDADALEYLLNTGVIYEPPYDAVFDFVDAVMRNRPLLAYNLLEQSYLSGEATLVLLTNLYAKAKQVLQVQSYHGDDIAKATGLTDYQIKFARNLCNTYSEDDLIFLLKLIRNVERGIKVGDIEDSIAVTYILSRFWL